jgi:hypothetical protein
VADELTIEMNRLADVDGRDKAAELVAHLGKTVPDAYVLVAQRAFMQTAQKALTDTAIAIAGDIDRQRLVERWGGAFAMELERSRQH